MTTNTLQFIVRMVPPTRGHTGRAARKAAFAFKAKRWRQVWAEIKARRRAAQGAPE